MTTNHPDTAAAVAAAKAEWGRRARACLSAGTTVSTEPPLTVTITDCAAFFAAHPDALQVVEESARRGAHHLNVFFELVGDEERPSLDLFGGSVALRDLTFIDRAPVIYRRRT